MLGTTIATVTDAVMGRTLWQEWSGFWPSMNDGFADFINAVPKHVVTSTLTGDLPWNSTAIDGDPVAHVRALANTGAEGDAQVGGKLAAGR